MTALLLPAGTPDWGRVERALRATKVARLVDAYVKDRDDTDDICNCCLIKEACEEAWLGLEVLREGYEQGTTATRYELPDGGCFLVFDEEPEWSNDVEAFAREQAVRLLVEAGVPDALGWKVATIAEGAP